MKKRIILIAILLIVLASFLIPVSRQKTVLIKSPFLNVYSVLANPEKWEKWQPNLKKNVLADSGKVAVKKDSGSFAIKYGDLKINVKPTGSYFDVGEQNSDKTVHYGYSVAPVPDKLPAQTFITVDQKASAFNYLMGLIWPPSFSDTHINDFKNYMEIDSLHYGFRIFKTGVPETYLIVAEQEVLKKDEFTAAAKLLADLQRYVKTNNVKQMQPLIAQFLPKAPDSVHVKVGFFIDKEVKSDKLIGFNRMPKGGPLYAVKFNGAFDKRQLAYIALRQYYNDHLYQSAILPFETYLDNKLPASDTSKVHIQVNFSGFF
jgi:effector-binding domain-containing protein